MVNFYFFQQSFYKIVTKDFYHDGGQACVNSIKKSWKVITNYGETSTSLIKRDLVIVRGAWVLKFHICTYSLTCEGRREEGGGRREEGGGGGETKFRLTRGREKSSPFPVREKKPLTSAKGTICVVRIDMNLSRESNGLVVLQTERKTTTIFQK